MTWAPLMRQTGFMDWWSDAPTPVPAELREAQAQAWTELAAAGSWWTGSQRIAIAEVARDALADSEPLAPWTAPSTIPGRIPTDSPIPEVVYAARKKSEITYIIVGCPLEILAS